MANSDTGKSIIDNVQSVVQAQGIKFDRKVYENDEAIPASKLPFGQIIYQGTIPEYTHGQRASYAEFKILLRVILAERSEIDVMRKQIEWISNLRDALTVNALNVVDLATSKLVSLVEVDDAGVDNSAARSVLNVEVTIRYREA